MCWTSWRIGECDIVMWAQCEAFLHRMFFGHFLLTVSKSEQNCFRLVRETRNVSAPQSQVMGSKIRKRVSVNVFCHEWSWFQAASSWPLPSLITPPTPNGGTSFPSISLTFEQLFSPSPIKPAIHQRGLVDSTRNDRCLILIRFCRLPWRKILFQMRATWSSLTKKLRSVNGKSDCARPFSNQSSPLWWSHPLVSLSSKMLPKNETLNCYVLQASEWNGERTWRLTSEDPPFCLWRTFWHQSTDRRGSAPQFCFGKEILSSGTYHLQVCGWSPCVCVRILCVCVFFFSSRQRMQEPLRSSFVGFPCNYFLFRVGFNRLLEKLILNETKKLPCGFVRAG